MLHLCVDARLYDASGIGTLIKTLLPRLPYRLTLLVGRKLPLDVDQISMKSGIYSAAEQLELPRKIPACDLFWSPHFNVPLLPTRAKKRLVTVHDMYHFAHFKTLSFKEKLYASLMLKAALTRSDHVMTDSQFSRDQIKEFGFTPKKLSIVPCCALLEPDDTKMEGLPERYILYVGNLKPHKNLKRLFAAKRPLPLVIVGKDFGEIELPDDVIYVGHVPDAAIPGLYTHADLFVFPSTYEGFGIPPLEAMRCGCPVVASRVASLPEVCGDAVEYVDPFSVESIETGIANAVNNKEQLIALGYENSKRFTPEKTVSKFMEVVDACCDRA